MLAAMTKSPAFAITENEAQSMASAANNVARHYDMGATQKQLDWINLVMTLGGVYAPRMMMAKREKKAARPSPVNDSGTANDPAVSAVLIGGLPHGV